MHANSTAELLQSLEKLDLFCSMDFRSKELDKTMEMEIFPPFSTIFPKYFHTMEWSTFFQSVAHTNFPESEII